MEDRRNNVLDYPSNDDNINDQEQNDTMEEVYNFDSVIEEEKNKIKENIYNLWETLIVPTINEGKILQNLTKDDFEKFNYIFKDLFNNL